MSTEGIQRNATKGVRSSTVIVQNCSSSSLRKEYMLMGTLFALASYSLVAHFAITHSKQ